jgi:uncharacterized membrane protein
LFINASASGDVVTNACSFLVIALFVRMIVEKKQLLLTKKLMYLGILFLLSLIISLNKVAYFPLVFLIFLIDKGHFNGLKNKLIVVFVLIFSNLAIIGFWAKAIESRYIKFEDYNPTFRVGQQLNEHVDPSLQMAFILQNPLVFTKIATYSLVKSLPHTLIHYVGKFGWEKNYLPLPIIVLLLLLIFVQAIIKDKDTSNFKFQISNSKLEAPLQTSNFKLQTTLGFLGVFILMAFSFAAAMYAIWCPVGSGFIDNLGGKYFIPIYPLFFLALPAFDGAKWRVLAFLAQPTVLFGAIWVSLVWSVFQVVLRYYV